MKQVLTQLLDNLITYSPNYRRETDTWNRNYDKLVDWINRYKSLPSVQEDRLLNRWFDLQTQAYRDAELNIVQSKKVASFLRKIVLLGVKGVENLGDNLLQGIFREATVGLNVS